MTGDATVIRLRREQHALQRLIHINALNHPAIDRYNRVSALLYRMERRAVIHDHIDWSTT